MTTSGGGGGGGGGGMKKGPWSAAEDAVLVEYVTKNGEGNWNAVQRNTGLLRCGKSCRLRWANHLRPNLKKGAFSPDEERLIIDLHSKLGNKWARISSHLPGRTDNEIKNYWNTRVKRRLRQGLPLYPNQNNSISTQTSKMPPSFPQPTSLPLSFHKNTPNNNNNNNFPLFNPISLPSSFFPLHHTPLFVSPHIQRRDLSTFSSHHVVSTSSLPMGGTLQLSSGGGYGSGFGFGFGFESSQVPMTRCGFEGFNFELPSNQHDQNQTYDHVVVSEVKDNNSDSNVDQTKSGLLDDMLQEAQVKVTGRGVKRERDDCGLDWDDPTSENSFTGIKKDELEGGQQSNSGKEDLSNLLDLIPSLVEVPDWCNDGGGDSPADQSTSNVSIEIHNDDKTKQQPPLSTTVMSTSDYEDNGDDWNNNNYSWDNLPRIY